MRESVRRRHTSVRHRNKHRLAIIGVVVFLVVLCAAAIGIYWYNADQQIQANQAAIEQNEVELKEWQQKVVEKLAAIEKARQEAAAKEAAELAASLAASGSDSGATVIDSASCNTATTNNNPASINVVVNKKHCIQPLGYAPGDLVTTNGATLSAQAVDAYNQLYAAAAAAGQGFYVTSSYRSYNDQVATYNYWVSVSGQAGADTYSARPGYSEHQTGFVIDVAANGCVLDCFGATSQYQWLQAHAAEYGFIQRYYAGYEAITGYSAEEWHYRYVGVDVATDMKNKGIMTLEEYYGISGGDYQG